MERDEKRLYGACLFLAVGVGLVVGELIRSIRTARRHIEYLHAESDFAHERLRALLDARRGPGDAAADVSKN